MRVRVQIEMEADVQELAILYAMQQQHYERSIQQYQPPVQYYQPPTIQHQPQSGYYWVPESPPMSVRSRVKLFLWVAFWSGMFGWFVVSKS